MKIRNQSWLTCIGIMIMCKHFVMMISKMMVLVMIVVVNLYIGKLVEDSVNNFHGGKTNNGKRVQG